MTLAMRKILARLPYEEKLRRVAESIEFSRAFKQSEAILPRRAPAPGQPCGSHERARLAREQS